MEKDGGDRDNAALVTLIVMLLIMAMGVSSASSASAAAASSQLRRNMLANGLGLTPPMGWNSWNHFHCKIDEKVIKATADALVSTGLSKLGYTYVNIGILLLFFSVVSFFPGNLAPNKSTFPSGIKALADYVHSKGLKLGIYADAG
ncbi:unnamed protein product [Malus baccata var. baccata]